jgi:hypothetical protein
MRYTFQWTLHSSHGSELPSYEEIIPSLLKDGIDGVKEACKLTPGVPLKPMLAKPTKAIGEVLDRFEGKRFTCEYKYDGERAQVHRLHDGTVGVFSRNSEDMSKKYPDLVEQLPHVRHVLIASRFDADFFFFADSASRITLILSYSMRKLSRLTRTRASSCRSRSSASGSARTSRWRTSKSECVCSPLISSTSMAK